MMRRYKADCAALKSLTTPAAVQTNTQEKSESPTTIRAEVPIGSFVSLARAAAHDPLIASSLAPRVYR